MISGSGHKKYIAVINEKKIPVEVVHVNEEFLQIKINGRESCFKVIKRQDDVYFVNRTGRVFRVDLKIERNGDLNSYEAYINGAGNQIKFMEESVRALESLKKTGTKEGVKFVRVSMPGKIVKVLVKEKDRITKGQELCIIEAMKMENVVKAPSDATILKILIEEGQNIESQENLFELK